MTVTNATDRSEWDAFLAQQKFRPFLQSWTMGDVYRDIGQPPVRLCMHDDDGKLQAICFGHIVRARRGAHISVPYGPVLADNLNNYDTLRAVSGFVDCMKREAVKRKCRFLRISPFWLSGRHDEASRAYGSVRSPLHLLAEHVWILPLRTANGSVVTEEHLLSGMRKTTRNLIRRAEKDGVTVSASDDPMRDLPQFIRLHDETRRRHHFTPYSNAYFTAELKRFSEQGNASLYLARYGDEVIAASIHIHAFGETSYHHGASAAAHSKVPASYLLQWTAIKDALKRGDETYNFWGIAPSGAVSHPFSGVTLFKTGFGGHVLNLVPCKDTSVSVKYWLTYIFEHVRKWRRGF